MTMRAVLIFLYSVVVLCVSITEAVFETCDAPPRQADDQNFKADICKNGDRTCAIQYEEVNVKSVFNFMAPEGSEAKKSDFGCIMTYYKKEDVDNPVIFSSCQTGEQKNIDEKYFNPEIKPIQAGESRFIVCWCGNENNLPMNEEGYLKADLLFHGKRESCYYGDVILTKERERTPEEGY